MAGPVSHRHVRFSEITAAAVRCRVLTLARHRSPELRETAVATRERAVHLRERAARLRERATQARARRGWRGFQGASDAEEPVLCAVCGKTIEAGSGRFRVGPRQYHVGCFNWLWHVESPQEKAE